MNHQAALAERRRNQAQAAAVRAELAASKAAERARRDAQRARDAAARASDVERKAAEREATRLHVEARLAEVAERNAELAVQRESIDGLLVSTLAIDDYVDLNALKVPVGEHPPFDAGELATATPALPALVYPPEPVYTEPPAPTGLAAAMGGKRKHAEALAAGRRVHDDAVRRWQAHCQRLYRDYVAEQHRLQSVETTRLSRLQQAHADYEQQCRQWDADAQEHNLRVDRLINDLAFDVPDAIEQYVDIVLSNSVYPDCFPVAFHHRFDLTERELQVTATVPGPEAVPTVKEYRYVKARDEITSTQMASREQKERYAGAVWQVAVRTLHEVFEADRAGKIASIALTVGTQRLSPGTGLPETIPLARLAADRATFTRFDLGNVIPAGTLQHLGATMSKSPFDLIHADLTPGVGVRKTT